MRRVVDRITGRATSARFAALERALRKTAEQQHAHSEALKSIQSTLAKLSDGSARRAATERDALRELRDAVDQLTQRIVRNEDPLFAVGRRTLQQELRKVATGEAPIIVGPWTGEVGFELLYWIPFVRWACAEYAIDPRRLLVVSRGGVASWYGVTADQYADVFSVLDPQEFRAAVATRLSQKQRQRDALDDRIVEAVRQRHGFSQSKLMHPGMMFRTFGQYWHDQVGYTRINEFARHALLTPPPAAARPAGLPSEYIAVRFYFRLSFQDKAYTRAFAEAVVRRLARKVPVVVLTSGVRVDDHHDWTDTVEGEGVTVLRDVAPERNLEVQSAIIAGARAFVGTYGGLSYLAPFYGVPALGFVSRRAFEPHHLYVAERVFEELGAPRLTMVELSQTDLVGSALQPLMADLAGAPDAPARGDAEARVTAATEELARARADLAAVEVKLDILEGAANALDSRLRVR